MFCAKKRPLPTDATDLGAISPKTESIRDSSRWESGIVEVDDVEVDDVAIDSTGTVVVGATVGATVVGVVSTGAAAATGSTSTVPKTRAGSSFPAEVTVDA